MKLKIMYKNRVIQEIKNVYRVSNLSTKFDNDCLYYETILDEKGKGTCVEFKEILCFTVEQ